MADTKTSGAGKHQTIDLNRINPLIADNGDTTNVQAVLGFLSFLMMESNAAGVALSSSDALGLAFILDTCRAALENTPECEVRHG